MNGNTNSGGNGYDGAKQDRKKYNISRIVTTVIILAIVGGIMLLSSVKAVIKDEQDGPTLSVQGTFMDDRVKLADITAVELLDEWTIGSRVNGADTFRTESGHYKNVAAGDYRLAVWKNTPVFIKVTHKGGVLVFNLKDEQTTRQFFQTLSDRIGITAAQS